MFFFGVFGVSTREKEIREISNKICKKCGAMTAYKMIKTYNVFHIFFIPIIKWGEKYFLKSRCCDTIFEISGELGRELEQDEKVHIDDNELREIYSNYNNEFYNKKEIRCRNCGSEVDSSFKYCPNCGEKLG
ncbi:MULTISPECIES: zinc ribbon domain-containing protein [Clostridium]|uniref:Zinc-ribbon 15 domain-containing protein n=2 Tax=Clostridium TaxID=1485 RepID=A0A151AP53_9CLOT|nr:MULTISPECIES: zinc ribbon domain-containing protein [Clostridium]KYH29340.1 hypothetical protein CLCOL_10830 [Clostridium colicanis DSM 13634]MBE6043132.1 zinc ribbon domain-containing protein [Clostridium thermopalmarium]PRR70946.1 hypothetical protein CPAL_20360 [Clostridium thermopalmarium DSM 5974]PVZ28869.1 zinc ribbon family protein [Clostridium thermopalmarium DSM 5974]